MAAASNFLENQLVDHILRGQTFSSTAPASFWIALYTAAPTDAGGGTEVTGNNYARVAVPRTLAVWAGTHGAGTTVASTGTGGVTSNNTTITFPVPSGLWGTVTHFGILDAVTGGNLILHGALTVARTINTGNTVSFAPGQLVITIA